MKSNKYNNKNNQRQSVPKIKNKLDQIQLNKPNHTSFIIYTVF